MYLRARAQRDFKHVRDEVTNSQKRVLFIWSWHLTLDLWFKTWVERLKMVLLDIANDYDWLSMASYGWCFDWNGVMILHVSSDEWQYCVGLPVLTRIGRSWLPILSHHQADAMLLHLSVCNDGVSFLSVIWESCLSSCAWSQLESGSVGMRLDWQYAPIMFFDECVYCTNVTICNQCLSWWNRCRA